MLRGRVVRRLAVGGPARHISVDRAGRRLWIALGTKASRIAVVDVLDELRPRLLGTIRAPFLAHDVGFARDLIWVTSGDRNSLALFDPRTARPVRRLAAALKQEDGGDIHVIGSTELVKTLIEHDLADELRLMIDPLVLGGGKRIFGDDGTLRTHDAATGRLLRTARIPTGSYNVQEGWGVILTPSLSQGTLCIVDSRGRLRRRVDVARSSHDSCYVVSA